MRTIVDLITTKFRISLTWRKSRSTQKKKSQRKRKRKKRKKIRNRRFFEQRKSRRSRKLRLQIASARKRKFLMMKRKKKMKIMFFRNHLRMTMMRIMWGCKLFFSFVLIYFSFKLNFFLCSNLTWSRVCVLNDDN